MAGKKDEQQEEQNVVNRGDSLDDVYEAEVADLDEEQEPDDVEGDSEDDPDTGASDSDPDPEDTDSDEEEDTDPDTPPEDDPKPDEDPEPEPEPEPEEEETPKEVEERQSRIEELEKELDIPEDIDFDTTAEMLKYQKEMYEKQDELRSLKQEQKDYEEQSEADKRSSENQKQWQSEFAELEKAEAIPPIKDPQNDNDPGVKARTDIFQWMIDHNSKTANDNQKIFSIDVAYKAMQSEKKEQEEADIKSQEEREAEEQRKSNRKKRGGMVGSGSKKNPAGTTKGTQDIHKGMTMDDVLEAELQNLGK